MAMIKLYEVPLQVKRQWRMRICNRPVLPQHAALSPVCYGAKTRAGSLCGKPTKDKKLEPKVTIACSIARGDDRPLDSAHRASRSQPLVWLEEGSVGRLWHPRSRQTHYRLSFGMTGTRLIVSFCTEILLQEHLMALCDMVFFANLTRNTLTRRRLRKKKTSLLRLEWGKMAGNDSYGFYDAAQSTINIYAGGNKNMARIADDLLGLSVHE
ncbi:hypothetical protein BJ170DRAFT_174032 [Xylariales sp. AK1849]|nr:hypothetical protein BJ170DRAFT_174032 [Xylariales sp. AK1849]